MQQATGQCDTMRDETIRYNMEQHGMTRLDDTIPYETIWDDYLDAVLSDMIQNNMIWRTSRCGTESTHLSINPPKTAFNMPLNLTYDRQICRILYDRPPPQLPCWLETVGGAGLAAIPINDPFHCGLKNSPDAALFAPAWLAGKALPP